MPIDSGFLYDNFNSGIFCNYKYGKDIGKMKPYVDKAKHC